jgi:hypothetical protein
LCLAISSQSLWIDEGVAVWLASQSSIRDLFSTLSRLNTSDPQMPLFLLYMWFWIRVFGIGETALRASNIPFALLLSLAFSWGFTRLSRPRALWLLVGLSPFLWVYMNEARPYILVAGCSTVSVLAASVLSRPSGMAGRHLWICIVSFLFLVVHTCQVLSRGGDPCLRGLEAQRRQIDWKLVVKDWKLPILTQVPFFLLLGLYYLLTLLRGSGGARGISGPENIAFALYEFLGFSGLGPPRNDLRANPHLATLLPYWPWLSMGILAGLGLVFIAFKEVLRPRRQRSELVSLIASLGVGGALLAVASILARFQFWGRHWVPLFPLFILSVALLLSTELPDRHSRLVQVVSFVMLVTAWTVSDVRLRLMPMYHKDDYRLAAEIALADHRSLGATIAWVADSATAQYYGLQAEDAPIPANWPARGKCFFASNWSGPKVDELVGQRSAPLVLVFSKPDLYDRFGAWSSAIRKLKPRRIAAPNALDIYLFDHR